MPLVDGLVIDLFLAANTDCEVQASSGATNPRRETPGARMERLTGRVAMPEQAPEDPLFAGMKR